MQRITNFLVIFFIASNETLFTSNIHKQSKESDAVHIFTPSVKEKIDKNEDDFVPQKLFRFLLLGDIQDFQENKIDKTQVIFHVQTSLHNEDLKKIYEDRAKQSKCVIYFREKIAEHNFYRLILLHCKAIPDRAVINFVDNKLRSIKMIAIKKLPAL